MEEFSVALRADPLLGSSGSNTSDRKVASRRTALMLLMAVLFWALLTVFDHKFIPKAGKTSPLAYEMSSTITVTYQWCMIAYLCNLLFSVPKLCLEKNENKKVLHLLIIYISFLSTSSYLLLWTGYSTISYDVNSCLFIPQRWLLYLFTAPAILAIMAQISDCTPLKKWWLYFIFEVMLVLGGLGSTPWLSWNTKVFFYIASVLPFPEILLRTWRMVLSAADETDTVSIRLLKFIAIFTEITWLVFPIIYFASIGGLLPLHISEPIWSLFDWMTKFLFSCSLMDANFYTLEQRREMMRKNEEAHRNEIILQLSRAIERKDDFLSTMSHELRTPLNGIIGLSDSLIAGTVGKLPAKALHTISIVALSAKRLLQLINDVLDAATLKQGKMVIKHEAVSVTDVVGDVVDLCTPLVRKNVKLVNMVGRVPKIIGDNGRIAQIMYNLVGNAAKFTSKGSITIMAGVSSDTQRLYITVKDTGEGIPATKLDKIFDAFEQVDMSTTRRHGGTGLGLHLVRELVKAHNGEITVQSLVGRGSTFTVWLPLTQNDMAQDSKGQTVHISNDMNPRLSLDRCSSGDTCQSITDITKSGDVLKSGDPMQSGDYDVDGVTRSSGNLSRDILSSGMRRFYRSAEGGILVLSVDDDPVNQLVIENLLCPEGYIVEQAMDGREALDYLDRCAYLPDVILLDVMMPGMSGFEVCQAIRQRFSSVMIPIIMVSAKASPEHVMKGLDLGSLDYVKKPFHRQELLSRIRAQVQCRETFEAELSVRMNQYLRTVRLPKHIREPRQGKSVISEFLPEVSILLISFEGFYSLLQSNSNTTSNSASAADAMNLLYCTFEKLLLKYQDIHVEQISNTFMVVAGYDGSKTHSERLLGLAQDVLVLVEGSKFGGKPVCQVHMGLHMGPAHAGVLGFSAPKYCIFGETMLLTWGLKGLSHPNTVMTSGATASTNPTLFQPMEAMLCLSDFRVNTFVLKAGEYLNAIKEDGAKASAVAASSTSNEVSELQAQLKEAHREAEVQKASEAGMEANLHSLMESLQSLHSGSNKTSAAHGQERGSSSREPTTSSSDHNGMHATEQGGQPATADRVGGSLAHGSLAADAHSWWVAKTAKEGIESSPVNHMMQGFINSQPFILAFLKDMGLNQYSDKIVGKPITLDAIANMSQTELVEMGIATVGARRRLTEAARQFCNLVNDCLWVVDVFSDRQRGPSRGSVDVSRHPIHMLSGSRTEYRPRLGGESSYE